MALRYQRKPAPKKANEPEQYQLFHTPDYGYRVFVTNLKEPIDLLVWFYNQRAGAENLIKEADNDASLAVHPSGRWMMELQPFSNRDARLQSQLLADAVQSRRTSQSGNAEAHHAGDGTPAVSIPGGQALATHPEESASATAIITPSREFRRLMERLRTITNEGLRFAPVVAIPLTG